MPNNPFHEILRDFQNAYATYGDRMFWVIGLTNIEELEHLEPFRKKWGHLGSITLNENEDADEFLFFGALSEDPFVKPFVLQDKPYKCFKKIAAKAGACLPLPARKEIPHSPEDPVSWWLSFLWYRKIPSKADLIPLDSQFSILDVVLRHSFSSPFLESITAIEEYGLLEEVNDANKQRLESRQEGVKVRRKTNNNIKPQQLEQELEKRNKKDLVNQPLDIDFPNPSEPMSKSMLVELVGGEMTVPQLTKLMDNHRVRYRKLSRKQFIFCRDDLPNIPSRH